MCAEGVRCYTKTVDGEVREAWNDISDAAIAQSVNAKDTGALESGDKWYPGTLKFHCSPDSSLCTFAVRELLYAFCYLSDIARSGGPGTSPSFTSQRTTSYARSGALPPLRPNGSIQTSFRTAACRAQIWLRYTLQMLSVSCFYGRTRKDGSAIGVSTLLIALLPFEAHAAFSRKAQSWVWDEQSTRLCKAIDGTGIGAASWNSEYCPWNKGDCVLSVP